jgi:hypothetical protein
MRSASAAIFSKLASFLNAAMDDVWNMSSKDCSSYVLLTPYLDSFTENWSNTGAWKSVPYAPRPAMLAKLL